MTGRVERVDRDEADRRVLGAVALGGDVALAGADRELHADLGALVEGAEHEVGVEDLDVADGVDVARRDGAGAGLAQRHALRALALHLDGDRLDVEDDVRHVLADARDRRELVQHAVDMHRRHRRALERGQEHAAQRVAERRAEAALERLGDDGRDALRIVARRDLELVRLDQLLPVLLNHVRHLFGANGEWCEPRMGRAAPIAMTRIRDARFAGIVRRGGACAGGSRCAGSASRRGSRSP